MALTDLIVYNRSGSKERAAVGLPNACVIGTCLRDVHVTTRDALQPEVILGLARGDGTLFQGAEAYGFLLRLASGLESEIAGETEIFGQIKQAWRDFETAHPEPARRLRPWMQRLLQETKEIRSEYIVGLGSATYGSLARRLLGGRPEGTTLLIGAGQLAATVLPYLDSPDLRIYNRSPARAFEMLSAARVRDAAYTTSVLEPTLEAELAAWREARDVVLCVPADPERDGARAAAWSAERGGRILHLGIMDSAGSPWSGVERLATLKDLFSMRDLQAEQRDALLARARRACLGKAQLAQLDDADGSRPGTSNHGWEDLAVFQAFGS